MKVSMHYSRAPLTEAIIDFQVTLHGDVTIDTLADIHPHISDYFPSKEEIYLSSVKVSPGTSTPINAFQQIHGFLFKDEDKLNIFQATLNGFTFNRLAPYTFWEELRVSYTDL